VSLFVFSIFKKSFPHNLSDTRKKQKLFYTEVVYAGHLLFNQLDSANRQSKILGIKSPKQFASRN